MTFIGFIRKNMNKEPILMCKFSQRPLKGEKIMVNNTIYCVHDIIHQIKNKKLTIDKDKRSISSIFNVIVKI